MGGRVPPADSTAFDALGLLPQHAALLAASAISPVVAGARAYRSVSTKAEAARLGFPESQRLVPALLHPIYNVVGEHASNQLRPDRPRSRDGKPIKYETAAGSRTLLDVPPPIRRGVGDPKLPLVVTEGIRKADSGASVGLVTVALLGVWNWRGTNEHGGKVALPDWESVALDGREVYVAFDSDAMQKPAVHGALARLGAFLANRKAKVRYVYLPHGEHGVKQGLDDYFAAQHTPDDLFAHASTELRGVADDAGSTGAYAVRDGRVCFRKREREGDVWLPLCNFSAKVIEEVVADDGATERGELVIEGATAAGTRLPAARVPLGRFAAMDWPVVQWGVRAVVAAGMGNRDRLREAVQLLSGDVPRRVEYRHPGFRRVDPHGWAFLHAGGAIGPDGPIAGVDVSLHGAASRLALPDPPAGEALRAAVLAVLGVRDVAPDTVTAPCSASASAPRSTR